MPTFPAANAPRFTFKVNGTDLQVIDFKLHERISHLFGADLRLASEEEVGFDEVIGQNGLLTIESSDDDRRVHGIVHQFVLTGLSGRFFCYEAHLAPQAWLLSLRRDSRIFQNMSVPDIVKKVLEDGGLAGDLFDFRLQGSYAPREFCVQYRESDLNFVSRLLEEEGIFYFFEHSDEKHLMVFGDGPVNYQPIGGDAQIQYNAGGGLVSEQDAVLSFRVGRQIRSGKYVVKDFNFEKPSLDLTAENADSEHQRLELYDYPGMYATVEEGRRIAQVRLQQATMFKNSAEGESVVPRFVPGFTFTLAGHNLDRLNREYLLVETTHTGAQPEVLAEKSAAQGEGTRYENDFMAVPSSVTIRPEPSTPRPVVEGVQTAIVTGPSGEEVYTDAHGRVKVRFHWDRQGRDDEHSSCWMRVSQLWAGAGWGAMFLPRIGQEVIVGFIEGDPDRPIVTGRVYHGTNLAPYPLPDERTKSTIKSDSSTGGGGSNELRFEDKKGTEEIYLHGQKDWTIAIENDKRQTIGHDENLTVANLRTKSVGADQSESIGSSKTISVGSNHTETIGANMTVSVGGSHTESIAAAKSVAVGAACQITIGAALNQTVGGAKAEEIGGARSIAVGGVSSEIVGASKSVDAGSQIQLQAGNQIRFSAGGDMTLNGQKQGVIEIKDKLTIKVGKASITLKKNGDIQIRGKKIDLKGSGDITLKGKKVLEN